MTPLNPIILTVAPNGAYKTHADHPQIPLTAEALAHTARDCLDAGAAMIHLHVRDSLGLHLLDATAYQAAITAIRRQVGQEMVVQITSEAAKRDQAPEQMAVVRAVHPEAVSLALKELMPDAASETSAAAFFSWLGLERIMVQVILYSAEELQRYQSLCARGVLNGEHHFLLFVLGRYSAGQQSVPNDLTPFLQVKTCANPWALCAFGPQESACILAATEQGGHARVGFENNLYLPNGGLAQSNAQLVALVAQGSRQCGRPLASANDIRTLFHADYIPS